MNCIKSQGGVSKGSRPGRFKLSRLSVACAAAATSAALLTPAADARITQLVIAGTESPTFGGYSWPGVGSTKRSLARHLASSIPRIRKMR